MQYIDLNIAPSKFQAESLQDALASLISNDVIHPIFPDYYQTVKVEYDEDTQELKITHQQFNLVPGDFVQQENTQNLPTDSLRISIAILLSRNIKLTFTSNAGTFIPIVKQKEGINEPLPNVYIQYESKIRTSNANNLKELYNNESIPINSTIISVYPVAPNLVQSLQTDFCYLKQWKLIYSTRCGNLLITNHHEVNDVYINGLKASFNEKINCSLAYSYDINPLSVNINLDEDQAIELIDEAIIKILSNLNTEDKKQIYPTLLNNEKSYEWSISKVQELILLFMNKLIPNRYVIYCDKFIDEASLMLVEEANKTLVKINDDIFPTLSEKIHDFLYVSQQVIASKYLPLIINDDLTFKQQNNLNLLDKFLEILANNYQAFSECMQQYHVDKFSWLVIENYPDHWGTYSFKENAFFIDEKNLDNLSDLFACAAQIIWKLFWKLDKQEFMHEWWKNSISFLTSYKTNQHPFKVDDEELIINHHHKKLS